MSTLNYSIRHRSVLRVWTQDDGEQIPTTQHWVVLRNMQSLSPAAAKAEAPELAKLRDALEARGEPTTEEKQHGILPRAQVAGGCCTSCLSEAKPVWRSVKWRGSHEIAPTTAGERAGGIVCGDCALTRDWPNLKAVLDSTFYGRERELEPVAPPAPPPTPQEIRAAALAERRELAIRAIAGALLGGEPARVLAARVLDALAASFVAAPLPDAEGGAA